ncbi:MAG: sulfotransferase domain-containing protein [Pseudomonadota bacterium]
MSSTRTDDLLRAVLLRSGRLLPEARRKRFARRVRGWHEARGIARANAVVLSHAKSGRTWLATMLAAYERAAGAPVGVFFSHDNYIRDWTARGPQPWHAGKRLVLLVREPGDVLVSFHQHWQHRMKPGKRWVNDYPAGPLSLWEFTQHPRTGLAQLIAFMNRLAAETAGRDDVLRVRYEDLRRAPQETLERLIHFVMGSVDPAAVRAAVEYGSFENMQRLERRNADDPQASRRLKPRDVNNPQSFKVRSGRVGGYRDAYTPEQVALIDAQVRASLDPSFGYPLT